ncbi:MAG TPA: DUF2249 domain-containing protein [Acidimicrobiales bacterium]|nr:DUF2249 domain-containing protein [Acidimicrobiales bacterium]
MTIENETLQAMLSHHRALAEGVSRRVGRVVEAVSGGGGFEPATAELVAYLADEVLPHALAEEHTIYPVARVRPELDDTVAGMVDEHRHLAAAIERLAKTGTGADAKAEAEAIDTLFAGHVAKENELILPPLAADPNADLARLLAQMHGLTEAAQRDTAPEDFAASDTDAALLGLLLDGAAALADAGQGDRACRLVASAWAALRVPRPELAVRTTAALHRLARSAAAEPVTFTVGHRHTGVDSDAELDVRALSPAQRHEKIFATYGALGPGGAFVLVNDHDPKPLRYQFEAEHAGEFTWEALEGGPTVWRVRIGRPAGAAPAGEPELDVRRFPHGQRHDVIFATYGSLAPGAGFVLVNDHDPKPLRYQFEAQHAGEYTWDYLEAGPELWRVRIGLSAAAAS